MAKTLYELSQQDMFYSSDVQERIEELESLNLKELEALRDLQYRAGSAGYDIAFIAESYFETYAQELAEDMYGYRFRDAEWPFPCIDWERAANDLKVDYWIVNIKGTTFYHRD